MIHAKVISRVTQFSIELFTIHFKTQRPMIHT